MSGHPAVIGVSTSPGATAFTRMSGASDSASSFVTWCSAALEAAYGMDEPVGRTPATDVMFTIEPRLCRSAGSAA